MLTFDALFFFIFSLSLVNILWQSLRVLFCYFGGKQYTIGKDSLIALWIAFAYIITYIFC